MSALSVLLLCTITGASGSVLGWSAGHAAGFRNAVDAATRLRRTLSR